MHTQRKRETQHKKKKSHFIVWSVVRFLIPNLKFHFSFELEAGLFPTDSYVGVDNFFLIVDNCCLFSTLGCKTYPNIESEKKANFHF